MGNTGSQKSRGRKGFVFTLAFFLLFTALLSQSIFFSEISARREGYAAVLAQDAKKAIAAADVSRDLQDFLEFNATAFLANSSNLSGPVVLRTWDRMPSTMQNSNPQSLLSDYSAFVAANYSNATNANVSIDASRLSSNPFIYFGTLGVNHSYSSLEKTGISVFGTSNVSNHSLFFQTEGFDSFEGCGWISQSPGTTLNATVSFAQISQSPCNPSSALLDASQASVFFFNTSSGKTINVTFGLVSGTANSLKVEQNSSNPVALRVRIDSVVQDGRATLAWMPVSMNFSQGNSGLQNLAVIEK